MLVIFDDEHDVEDDVGDDEVASSEVAGMGGCGNMRENFVGDADPVSRPWFPEMEETVVLKNHLF